MDFLARLAEAKTAVMRGAERVGEGVRRQWERACDRDAWDAAGNLSDRLRAISLPHAGLALGVLVGVAVGLTMLLNGEPKPAPPPLPSRTALESVRSAGRAYEAELSPALAAANRTVPTTAGEPRP